MEELLKELQFQLFCYEDGTIDSQDFHKAIEQIHSDYKHQNTMRLFNFKLDKLIGGVDFSDSINKLNEL